MRGRRRRIGGRIGRRRAAAACGLALFLAACSPADRGRDRRSPDPARSPGAESGPAAPVAESARTAAPELPDLAAFFAKDEVTIAVTDSGLGGLSVMAEAAARMKTAGVFRRARYVFHNALFSSEGGYTTLATMAEKAARFDESLARLVETHAPDLILIACNTLSIVYPATEFAKAGRVPVIPIVPTAAGLIVEEWRDHPDASVLIFGTATTIGERAYQDRLVEAGIAAERIVGQACPELEQFIERDPAGLETELLIAGNVDEALAALSEPRPPVVVSLNCTHYGYSLPLWEKAFADAGVVPLALINPNSALAGLLFPPDRLGRFQDTKVSVEVVSRVEIPQGTIDSIGAWLRRVSPETADALAGYRRD